MMKLLRIVMSIFDPVGLFAHALIRPKVLIQETWRFRIDWDDGLTPLLNEKFTNWLARLSELQNVKINRAYSPSGIKLCRITMHTFVDAYEIAFAAVIYFRMEFNTHVELTLVSSKAKVAPNKVLSIPKLELQAAVLGCRLANAVATEHHVTVERKFFWSDSKGVLSWIYNDDPQRLKPFVAVRISEITELCSNNSN